MKKILLWQGRETGIEVTPESGGWKIALPDAAPVHVEVTSESEGIRSFTIDGRTVSASTVISIGLVEVSFEGRTYAFETSEPGRVAPKRKTPSGSLQTPMPGVVSAVMVAAGDAVEAYQPLVVVEAMKVMATLEAPFAGTVRRLLVVKGEQVKQGQELIEIDPTVSAEEAKSDV